MLKLKPKLTGTRKDGSAFFAYNLVGSKSEIENYIRVVTTCESHPKDIDKLVNEDGTITVFENNLVPSEHNEVFLSETYGSFTRNSLRKSLNEISQKIEAAEAAGSSTRILEKKENILIEQDMKQEAQARVEMDKAMSDYRNANPAKTEEAPKAKAKSKAKASASTDEDDLV